MKAYIVTMPIKYLYVKNIKLRYVFKIVQILSKLCYEDYVDVDFERFVSDITNIEFLSEFCDIKSLFDYCIDEYVHNDAAKKIELDDYSTILKCDIGDFLINLDTFMFLNKIIYPELLETHIECYQRNSFKEYVAKLGCSFGKEEICSLYGGMNFKDALKEFKSDFSLYLTYNEIGGLILPEEIIYSQDEFKIKVQLGI